MFMRDDITPPIYTSEVRIRTVRGIRIYIFDKRAPNNGHSQCLDRPLFVIGTNVVLVTTLHLLGASLVHRPPAGWELVWDQPPFVALKFANTVSPYRAMQIVVVVLDSFLLATQSKCHNIITLGRCCAV